MDSTHHDFVAGQYGVRAEDYVTSTDHSTGDDLDQIEREVRGCVTARVLDLGCGGGHVAYRAAPEVAEVVAVDLSPAMLEAVARTAAERGLRNIRVQQAAAERLPFPDACFDIVLCRFSAHHWHDLEAGLREARRMLVPAGRAVFIDTVAPGDPVLDTHLQAIELLRDASHVRNRTAGQWVAALERARFGVTGLTARKMPLAFGPWIARTRTAPLHAKAIRSVLAGAPPSVRSHFAVAEDGSFSLDTLTLTARAA